MHLHDYVNHKELTCHIILPKEMSLKDAHEITTRIEDKIKRALFRRASACECHRVGISKVGACLSVHTQVLGCQRGYCQFG